MLILFQVFYTYLFNTITLQDKFFYLYSFGALSYSFMFYSVTRVNLNNLSESQSFLTEVGLKLRSNSEVLNGVLPQGKYKG